MSKNEEVKLDVKKPNVDPYPKLPLAYDRHVPKQLEFPRDKLELEPT
jgi:hypothetical protein